MLTRPTPCLEEAQEMNVRVAVPLVEVTDVQSGYPSFTTYSNPLAHAHPMGCGGGSTITHLRKSRNARVLAVRMVEQHLTQATLTSKLPQPPRNQTDTITNSHLHHHVLGLMVPHALPRGSSDPLEIIDTKL